MMLSFQCSVAVFAAVLTSGLQWGSHYVLIDWLTPELYYSQFRKTKNDIGMLLKQFLLMEIILVACCVNNMMVLKTVLTSWIIINI